LWSLSSLLLLSLSLRVSDERACGRRGWLCFYIEEAIERERSEKTKELRQKTC
jgi:hypothetical protein